MKYAVVNTDGSHEIKECNFPLDIRLIREVIAAPGAEGIESAMVEVVAGPNVGIYLNENGKYLPLETNPTITNYARERGLISPFDWVVGNCVITGPPDSEGYETDVVEDVLHDILKHRLPHNMS